MNTKKMLDGKKKKKNAAEMEKGIISIFCIKTLHSLNIPAAANVQQGARIKRASSCFSISD